MDVAKIDHGPASAILIEKGGRFYFYQPGSGVITSADTISAAYERFVDVRRDYLEEVDRAGLAATSLPSAKQPTAAAVARPHFVRELQLFIAKTFIVLIIVGAIGALVGGIVGGVVGNVVAALGGIQPISISDVADKAEIVARDFRSLPPDQRETLRRSLAEISRELTPLVDAWRNPDAPPSQGK